MTTWRVSCSNMPTKPGNWLMILIGQKNDKTVLDKDWSQAL